QPLVRTTGNGPVSSEPLLLPERRRRTHEIERTRKMRKLIMNTFLTLDGVMQAPGGPEEDDSGGFAHGGWSVNYWDEQMGQVMGEAMGKPFDLVLGRKTYDIFAAYWPHSKDDAAKPLNDATKYVASRSGPHAGVEQVGPDRGRRGRRHRGAQEG